jgi:hypothetical protein
MFQIETERIAAKFREFTCSAGEPIVRRGVPDNVSGEGMAKGNEYRRYASECVRLAQHTTGAAEKALLLQMAETWRRLAERADARKRDDDGRKGC